MTAPSRSAYAEAVHALAERGRFGIRLGLGRTRALLRELGDPHLALRGALVGGTNGKGSVLAMCGSVLREAGYLVGETPKPHLVSYRERLQIDGEPISPAEFTALADRVLPLADKVARRHGEPTEFEMLTGMLFRWFADRGVQVALVEVGLGGRLDATNVWDGGVAAITNVDLDHMDRLGPTIEAIAREKAPIIKRGDLAVTGAVEPALSVIRRRAGRMGAPLRVTEPLPVLELTRDGIVAGGPGHGPWSVALRGRHQAANLAVAEGVLDALAEAGIATTTSAQRAAGYRTVRWPGRLELLDIDGRDVLLDGAHNAAGARALATALDDLRPHLQPGRLTLVLATMADKDVDAVIRALFAADALRDAAVIATSLSADRALSGPALADRVRASVDNEVTVVADPDAALTAALGGYGPIIVAGSLYLVGVARARFVDDPLLRDPA